MIDLHITWQTLETVAPQSAQPQAAKGKLTSKEKKALRKKKAQQETRCPVKLASRRDDILADVAALSKFERNGLSLEVAFFKGEDLPWETRAWCFDLLKQNMEALYAEDWDDKEKRDEIRDDAARFLIAAVRTTQHTYISVIVQQHLAAQPIGTTSVSI